MVEAQSSYLRSAIASEKAGDWISQSDHNLRRKYNQCNDHLKCVRFTREENTQGRRPEWGEIYVQKGKAANTNPIKKFFDKQKSRHSRVLGSVKSVCTEKNAALEREAKPCFQLCSVNPCLSVWARREALRNYAKGRFLFT